MLGRVIGWTAIILLLSACTQPSGFVPDVAKKLIGKGWTYVDVPSELGGPGTIVSLSEHQGLRFRGDVKDCVPEDYLEVKRGDAGLQGTLQGKQNLGVSAFIGFHSIKLGPEFSEVRDVKLIVGKSEREFLNEVKLSRWLNANLQQLDPVCEAYIFGLDEREKKFVQPDIVIIGDTLKLTGYEYEFSGANEIKIKLDNAKLGNVLTVGGGVNYSATESGNLKVDSPLYIAFKEIRYRPGQPVAGAEANDTMDVIQQRRIRALTQ